MMFGFAGMLLWLPFTLGGDRSGDWVVDGTAVIMIGFGVFATFGLIAALKTPVTLSATTFEAMVVAGHDALLIPHFRRVRLPLSDVAAVERRCEIFRTLGFYSMREALSVMTKEGERIGVCSDTMGSASTLPLDQMADAIAVAAGIDVTDDGTVRTGASGLYGAASSTWTEAPLDAVRASKARRAAIITVQMCAAVLLLTLALRACL
ncbi:MAG TPA: hypothetical protein VGK84_01125 [Candidatus Tumulicola sp.]